MRGYPNMSYCMFENTMAAMQQCASAIEQALEREDPLSLNQYEHRPFNEMYEMCNHLMHLLGEYASMVQTLKEEEENEEAEALAEQDEG